KLVQIAGVGVPDVYQGTELWDRSLVDPDNRRPVDYDRRTELLALQDAGELPAFGSEGGAGSDPEAGTASGSDADPGTVKLLVTSTALRLRRDRPELFTEYTPLEARGSAASHLVAFDRGGAVALATRLPIGLARHGGWDDTTVELPAARNGWVDTFTGRLFGEGTTRVAELLAGYPVALLQRIDDK
ncbi:MAG: malto-oligosyltrehalose synthase, partial [Herbiconiux sp.]|nr:malto-oligosyltrehalose synthase [Herbiconiux sp.]